MKAAILLATLLATGLSAAPAGGTFTLSIFEGFHFPSSQVVKSGTDTADLSFTYQTRRIGFISYLGAERINFFPSAPAGVSAAEVNSWKDYVAGPEPGYYVLRARSNQRLYLVHLIEFANQGRAASYWKMRFEWQEFGGGPGASERSSSYRYGDDSRGYRNGPDDGNASGVYRRNTVDPISPRKVGDPGPAVYNNNSRVNAAGSRVDAAADRKGDSGLEVRRIGRDVAYEARRRVSVELRIVTPLTAGLGGELKWIALCEPGTREKVGTDMVLPSLKVILSVPPGRYDLWIEGRNSRAERLRTVDLSGFAVGDVVAATVDFPGWGSGQRSAPNAEPPRRQVRSYQDRSDDSAPVGALSDGDAEERIRRAQEKAAQRSRSTDADVDLRIRRAQEAAAKRNP